MGNKVPQEVEQYRAFLTASYERIHTTKDQWPPLELKEYVKLTTVEKVEDFMKEDDYIKAMMNGSLEVIKKMKQPIEMEKIGRFNDGTLASCIIVEGIPGVGKSTLAWQLGRRWGRKEILQHFQLVIVQRLRDERVQKAHTMSELFYHPVPEIQHSIIKFVSTTLGEGVLLILDGYDELPTELQIGDRSIFAGIMKGEEFPKLTVLVTSRPSANRNIYQLCRSRSKCQYIEVVGFGEEEIREYVEHAFKHNVQLKEGFLSYIAQCPHICSLMYVPINCAIVVEVYKEHKGKPPQTLTEVYIAITKALLQRHEKMIKEKTLLGIAHTDDTLKKHYSDLMGAIQDPAGLASLLYSGGLISLAVRDEVQQRGDLITKRKNEVLINAMEAQVTMHPSVYPVLMQVLKNEPSLSTIVERMNSLDVTSSKMSCFEGLSATTLFQLQSIARMAYQGTLNDQLIFRDMQDNIESLGLFQMVPQLYLTSSPRASYNFIHKTLQEFLSAWYVSSLPTSEQRVFVNDSITKPNMAMTVRFMVGLTKFQTSSENIDGLAKIFISLESTNRQKLLENLHWMFETQNSTFIQRLLGNKEQKLNFSSAHLNPFDFYVLGYCIANSSTFWNVDLSHCGLTDECMRMLVLVEKGNAFHHIISLNLSWETVTIFMATILGMMLLKENNSLKELNLGGCILQPEGLEEVFKSVQINTKLESLDLSCNTIDNWRASCLGRMLEKNNSLKELNLYECKLQPEGLEEVIKGVQVNTKLETLVLSCNTIDNKRASCLGMMLKENNTLKELNLWGCKLQSEGLEEVIKVVQINSTLETLVLSFNTIDNNRASCVGMMLKENNTLKGLNLFRCELQPEGLEAVIKGVQVNTKLETLVLSYNIIDNKRASWLGHVLKHNTTLSLLGLWRCDLRDEAICELCNGLQWCKLRTLILWNNPFGDQGAKGLAEMLRNHPTLEELGVYGCEEMSDDGVQCLTDAMMSNTRVKMLRLSNKYKHLVPQELLHRAAIL